MGFQSLLDFFSLAAFLPLIVMIVDPEQGETGLLKFLFETTELSGYADIHGLILFIVIFFLLKLMMNSWITYRKARFAYRAGNRIAANAMEQFFLRPYTRFMNIDFTEEMNKICNLPVMFSNNIIIPAANLLAEAGVALLLVIGIAWYDVNAFLYLTFIVAPVILVYRLNRKKIKRTSEEIKVSYPRLLKYTLQAVEGFAEIKIFRRESFFRKKFYDAHQALGKTFTADHTLHATTARITEVIAVLSICVLILYASWTDKTRSDILLLLSLYVGASFRIIPSVNRIFGAILQIRTHEYVIHDLQSLVSSDLVTHDASEKPLSFVRKLELSNISFDYTSQQKLLQDVSLTIVKGETIGIIGKSGSGKTTLFLILLRFLKESNGAIRLDGQLLTDADARAFRKLIGYVPQLPYILDGSIIENIAFGVPMREIDIDKVHNIVDQMNLQSWVNSLPQGLNTIIGEKGGRISGGQRQRLAIARALYHNCEIFLFDEVTNQLDRETEREVIQALKQMKAQGKTILIISHQHTNHDLFDMVYELKEGRLRVATTQPG